MARYDAAKAQIGEVMEAIALCSQQRVGDGGLYQDAWEQK